MSVEFRRSSRLAARATPPSPANTRKRGLRTCARLAKTGPVLARATPFCAPLVTVGYVLETAPARSQRCANDLNCAVEVTLRIARPVNQLHRTLRDVQADLDGLQGSQACRESVFGSKAALDAVAGTDRSMRALRRVFRDATGGGPKAAEAIAGLAPAYDAAIKAQELMIASLGAEGDKDPAVCGEDSAA